MLVLEQNPDLSALVTIEFWPLASSTEQMIVLLLMHSESIETTCWRDRKGSGDSVDKNIKSVTFVQHYLFFPHLPGSKLLRGNAYLGTPYNKI